MSLSSGPLTAPLARTRGATAAGSMTRIRYVSRVPGPWKADSANRSLVNDDSATRFLECRARARPTAPVVGQPSAEQAGRQGDHDPQRQRAGADRRPRYDEGVGIAGRTCDRDADFELAGARAGAARAGREMLRERRALHEGQLAIQLGVDLHEPLLVC